MINLPEEFKNRMKDQLQDGYDDFIKSYEMPSYKAVRLNRRKLDGVDHAQMCRIATGKESPEEVKHWDMAYYYDDTQPGASPLHFAGAYYIQEPSAMLPVSMLNVDDSGLKVLDLCAAPGGKTTQIADLMNGIGLLVANEIVPSRASILSENIERMGVTNCLLTCEDPTVLAARFPSFFDRILVDAPCSGEGMFRKNPEAVSEWSPENVKMCAERQDMILDCAAKMLAPGGRIVYSTCTFSYDEDEGAANRFTARHPEYMIAEDPHRIYPHTHKGEGHFAVAFSRIIDLDGGIDADNNAKKSSKSALSSVEDALLSDFLKDTFCENSRIMQMITDNKDRLTKFGDGLYLAPCHMPDIKGLKVIRAGIKLGTFKKNRFEPDHALSHAVTSPDVKCCIDIEPDSKEITDYLKGLSIPCDRSLKGWCLVCTMNLPVGWGKASGGMIKNHFPRGLRIQG